MMRRRKVIDGKKLSFALIGASVFTIVLASADAETIKVGGTGAALGAMRMLGESFKKTNPTVDVAEAGAPKGRDDRRFHRRGVRDDDRVDQGRLRYFHTEFGSCGEAPAQTADGQRRGGEPEIHCRRIIPLVEEFLFLSAA